VNTSYIKFTFIVVIAFFSLNASGQDRSIEIKKVENGSIVIDGVLNEEVWKNTDPASDFYQQFPYDGKKSRTKTKAYVCFDDENLYVAAICYDSLRHQPFILQSLKRDYSYPVSDAFAVYLDPFEDQTNGFSFSVNPKGAQREGSLENGGTFGVSTAWDARWFSQVSSDSTAWYVEMRIPFKSIRFRKDAKSWGINFSRNNLKINENSVWSAVPRNFNPATLAYTGKAHFEEAPEKPKLNAAIIPYTLGSYNKDKENDQASEFKNNFGLDAKIAITSSLNLDLTVNPDFSQVEVDRQQVNLTRFSLFFPERRLFFIENSDLFSQFGFRQIRPFFSRRIGLSSGQQIPISAGARLSGKMGKNWRVGLMNMQTERKAGVADAQNYTVAAFQRQVFKTSNIAGIFVNRQTTDGGERNESKFNRVLGLDYNLYAFKNKLRGKLFYHQSFSEKKPGDQFTHASWLFFQDINWAVHWNHEYVGKNYNAETGFVPRLTHYDDSTGILHRRAYWRYEPDISYKFYLKSKKILFVRTGLYNSSYFDSSYNLTDFILKPYVGVQLKNNTEFGVRYNKQFTKLLFPSDVIGTEDAPILTGEHHYFYYSLYYKSNSRKKFYYSLSSDFGKFYTADAFLSNVSANYRYQPWGTFSVSWNQNNLNFPGKDPININLVGAQAELSFTTNMYFSTFVQYNTQADNVNINSRFQWRFRPMSDLFIVYSDNYNAVFRQKNRAITLKFIYWLNT
jgi:hypothetical protein